MSKTAKIVLGVIALIIVVPMIAALALYNKGVRNVRTMMSGSSYSSMDLSAAGLISPRDKMVSEQTMAMPPMQPRVSDENMRIAQPPSVDNQSSPRLIVKNGSLSLVVKDVGNALVSIKTYAESNGGYVVESNTYKSGSIPYGVIIVRIPAKIFEVGVGNVKSLGEVVSESIHGSDVTAEYVDLESQIKNLRASEQQFLEIMKRAGSITEVLAVQNELTRVRGQIEGIQGRMKYLKESAEMSSLTVNLSTDPSALPIVENDSSQWKPVVVVKDALRNLLEVGKGLVNMLIWIVIFIPVWGGAIVVAWFVYKRTKKNSLRK